MSQKILKKLASIFSNQQKILQKLALGDDKAESVFLSEMEKIKQTPEWQNASHEKKLDFESDLREAVRALVSEDVTMGDPNDLG
jgi:hypothetical protein